MNIQIACVCPGCKSKLVFNVTEEQKQLTLERIKDLAKYYEGQIKDGQYLLCLKHKD